MSFRALGRALLAALPASLFAGCAGASYEDAAREVARAVGADDLTVLDSASNFPANSGRTVRFAVKGDPFAVVTLPFTRPGACENNRPCAEVLRESIAYARGQSAFAARLSAAFAPCGFRAAGPLALQNLGREARHQFVQVVLLLHRPAAAGHGEAARAAVLPCATALARGVGGRRFAPDDPRDWAARPVEMVIFLQDAAGTPAPKPPLVLGWADVMRRGGAGPASTITARLADGAAEVGAPEPAP